MASPHLLAWTRGLVVREQLEARDATEPGRARGGAGRTEGPFWYRVSGGRGLGRSGVEGASPHLDLPTSHRRHSPRGSEGTGCRGALPQSCLPLFILPWNRSPSKAQNLSGPGPQKVRLLAAPGPALGNRTRLAPTACGSGTETPTARPWASYSGPRSSSHPRSRTSPSSESSVSLGAPPAGQAHERLGARSFRDLTRGSMCRGESGSYLGAEAGSCHPIVWGRVEEADGKCARGMGSLRC